MVYRVKKEKLRQKEMEFKENYAKGDNGAIKCNGIEKDHHKLKRNGKWRELWIRKIYVEEEKGKCGRVNGEGEMEVKEGSTEEED